MTYDVKCDTFEVYFKQDNELDFGVDYLTYFMQFDEKSPYVDTNQQKLLAMNIVIYNPNDTLPTKASCPYT